jgi:hypothetical protein
VIGRYLFLAAGGSTPRAVPIISMEGGKSSKTAGLSLATWASDSGAELLCHGEESTLLKRSAPSYEPESGAQA